MTPFAIVCLILFLVAATIAYVLHRGMVAAATRNVFLRREVIRLEDLLDDVSDELERVRVRKPAAGIVKTAMKRGKRA